MNKNVHIFDVMDNKGVFFGNNLKKIRKSLGLTQAEFAEKLGLGTRGYQRHEQGENDPTIATVKKYSKILNVNYMDMLIDPDNSPQSSPNPEPTLDERILSEIRRATQESIQEAFKEQALKNGREYVPTVMEMLQVALKDLPESKLQSMLEYALKIKNPRKQA